MVVSHGARGQEEAADEAGVVQLQQKADGVILEPISAASGREQLLESLQAVVSWKIFHRSL